MQTQKRTFYEEFSMAFSRSVLWEKCRELSRVLPMAAVNELHMVFPQICGEIFGYAAGGVGFGWDLASLTRTSNGSHTYTGLSQSYKDFSAALSFLGSNGPLFEVIQKLMHDPSHLYEFPLSQLPPSFQKTRRTGMTSVGLTAFEYYLYHFASLLVRRQKQNMAPTNVNINATNETLFVLLFEDYLTSFLPIDPALQAKLFTQPFQPSRPCQPTIKKSSPPNKGGLCRPSLFKKNFSPRFREDEPSPELLRQNEASRSVPSSETWRSDTLVKIIIMFWIEGYASDDAIEESANNSPSPRTDASSPSMDYVSASLKVASSLPSAELMRAVRMFIKHSHYFLNACRQGSAFLPASMKVDVFSTKTNKVLLLSFFAQAIDHWPYDASFRLVLETWLSFIQPWRYLNMNTSEDEGPSKMDPARFSSFVSDNYLFYSKLLGKVLRRFQRLDIGSPMNAFMLLRIVKVFSQDNLFPCIKSTAMAQGHAYFRQDANSCENIFSAEFKDFTTCLLMTALKCVDREKKKQKVADSSKAGPKSGSSFNFSAFFSSVANFINGGSDAAGDAEKLEREKVVQHLTFVTEKLSAMFELDQVLREFKTFPPSNDDQRRRDSFTQESIDQTDFMSSPNFGLSPEQRRGLLNRKLKTDGKYQGNPDLVPIRSDEIPFLVRMLHCISVWINARFASLVEDTYHRHDVVGSIFREIAASPTVYLARVETMDCSFNATSKILNSSFHGIPKQPVKLPARIVLRSLGSYIAVSYLSMYFVFFNLLLGKSLFFSIILLLLCGLLFIWIKSMVHPKPESNTEFSTSKLNQSF